MNYSIILSYLFLSSFTVNASWTKVKGYKFISGTSLGSETTYFRDVDYVRPLCKQRCDDHPPCKAIRLYNFAGTVYCTLFESISGYSCPTDSASTDWNCLFADGESWEKSN